MRTAKRVLSRIERPAAWALLIGAGATFIGVLLDLIATGNAKPATLLISADLFISGFDVVRDAEDG